MKLTFTQSQRYFDYGDRLVTLRVILPSPKKYGWPGSSYTIRLWMMSNGLGMINHCEDSQVSSFEAELGEVDPKDIRFVEHPTLGRVVAA